jgi:predicted nucleotidyltransferase
MTLNIAANAVRTLIAEAVKDNPLVEAAALYGSVARGDVEPHSDIDLLLLCRSGQKKALFEVVQPALSREFNKLSLALYSHDELKFLDRTGSLFLLHLKREADVLFDRAGFLSTLLSGFRPKPSYCADFSRSLDLLDPLRTRIADSPNDLHRLSYVYSLFRVFGVYLLATRGIFEFSKSKMAACLSREYPQTYQAIAQLSGLRILNANFFSGGSQSQAPEWLSMDNTLSRYISSLAAFIDRSVVVFERPYSEAVEEFSRAAAPFRGLNYRLRTWFLLLVYDGINLYCQRADIPPLTSFQPERLEEMVSNRLPAPVATAARQTLIHIRDYRLKYFLNKDAKIMAERAIDVLQALSLEI